MPKSISGPAVSIVLEWETGEEAGDGRAAACLAELNRQVWAARDRFGEPAELILVHDPVPKARLEAAAAAAGLTWPGRFELAEPASTMGYYEKKNFGFARSCGEIAVFVDSDLAPEPGWLDAIVAPFADRAKNVVVGLTHFEVRTLYERAMALFWIFDARSEQALVRPTRRLVSNNVAFRRAVFAALPFPNRGTYRGQCSELGAKLEGLGIRLHEATHARMAHPAPAGALAFVRRAFSAGLDAAAYARIEGRCERFGWLREWQRDLASVRRRIAVRTPAISPTRRTRLAAEALGLLYYTVKASGYLTALARPGHLSMRAEPLGGL